MTKSARSFPTEGRVGAKVGRLASPGNFENQGSPSVVARNRLTENRMGREPRKLRREMQRALHAKLDSELSALGSRESRQFPEMRRG